MGMGILGAEAWVQDEVEYPGVAISRSARILRQMTQFWWNVPNLYYGTDGQSYYGFLIILLSEVLW